jgi:drug/metabolite transporter (DMT)-like permease
MGAIGFSIAFALTNWGIQYSSATNAALLIIVEPLTLLLLAPALLGERLTRREAVGAALALLGAVIVVTDGIPGVTLSLLPRWRGDALLALSGVAYAAYSLLGRPLLRPENATAVTARSIVWGAVAVAPLVALEWMSGARPTASVPAVAGTLYLALVITAWGYVVWNWALVRVEASRAAAFLTVQPVVGALLGAALLGDPVSVYTAVGGALIVVGLWMSAGARP